MENCLFLRLSRFFVIDQEFTRKQKLVSGKMPLIMRPQDLKFPYYWDRATPLIEQGILYISRLLNLEEDYKSFISDLLVSFPRICIEYCSGTGNWIFEKAKIDPTTLWIAVEKRFDRVQRIWSKKENFQIPNLLIVRGEALLFTKRFLPDHCISEMFINFPDPWPKLRHAKHRLVQRGFIEELERVGTTDVKVTLATDDLPYSLQMINEMEFCNWISSYPPPYYVTELPEYGSSFFRSLWTSQGRQIQYMKFSPSKSL